MTKVQANSLFSAKRAMSGSTASAWAFEVKTLLKKTTTIVKNVDLTCT